MTETTEGECDVTVMTVALAADTLGITPRRVRQLREDGALVSRGRGLIDAPHALNAHVGRRVLGAASANVDKFELAAVGWLLGHQSCGVGADDLEIWRKVAAKWGLSEAGENAALMNGAALLGDRAPRFDAKPTKGRRGR